MNPTEFQTFLGLFAEGKPEALQTLLDSFEGPFQGLVRAFIHERGLRAEVSYLDVVISMALRLLRRGLVHEQFPNWASFRRWFLVCVLRRLENLARRRRHQRELTAETTAWLEDPEPEPLQTAADEEVFRAFRDQLGTEDFRVFLLREVEGLSWAQIGDALGIQDMAGSPARQYRRRVRAVIRSLHPDLEEGRP